MQIPTSAAPNPSTKKATSSSTFGCTRERDLTNAVSATASKLSPRAVTEMTISVDITWKSPMHVYTRGAKPHITEDTSWTTIRTPSTRMPPKVASVRQRWKLRPKKYQKREPQIYQREYHKGKALLFRANWLNHYFQMIRSFQLVKFRAPLLTSLSSNTQCHPWLTRPIWEQHWVRAKSTIRFFQ